MNCTEHPEDCECDTLCVIAYATGLMFFSTLCYGFCMWIQSTKHTRPRFIVYSSNPEQMGFNTSETEVPPRYDSTTTTEQAPPDYDQEQA